MARFKPGEDGKTSEQHARLMREIKERKQKMRELGNDKGSED